MYKDDEICSSPPYIFVGPKQADPNLNPKETNKHTKKSPLPKILKKKKKKRKSSPSLIIS